MLCRAMRDLRLVQTNSAGALQTLVCSHCDDCAGMAVKKIVSGGQTGVDRAALDAALAAQFPCGGWVTWDRMAEDGYVDRVCFPGRREAIPGGCGRNSCFARPGKQTSIPAGVQCERCGRDSRAGVAIDTGRLYVCAQCHEASVRDGGYPCSR